MNVMKAETIVGHVPREMSRTFWHFIRHGGRVGCEITGRRTLGRGGGGRINEGGAFTIPMWKIGLGGGGGGGGGINEGGRSDGRLWYMYIAACSHPDSVQPTCFVRGESSAGGFMPLSCRTISSAVLPSPSWRSGAAPPTATASRLRVCPRSATMWRAVEPSLAWWLTSTAS